jgi:hypothetical protein
LSLKPRKAWETFTREELTQACAATQQYHGGEHMWRRVEFLVEWEAAHKNALDVLVGMECQVHSWTQEERKTKLKDLQTRTELHDQLWKYALRKPPPLPAEIELPEFKVVEAPTDNDKKNKKKKQKRKKPKTTQKGKNKRCKISFKSLPHDPARLQRYTQELTQFRNAILSS